MNAGFPKQAFPKLHLTLIGPSFWESLQFILWLSFPRAKRYVTFWTRLSYSWMNKVVTIYRTCSSYIYIFILFLVCTVSCISDYVTKMVVFVAVKNLLRTGFLLIKGQCMEKFCLAWNNGRLIILIFQFLILLTAPFIKRKNNKFRETALACSLSKKRGVENLLTLSL